MITKLFLPKKRFMRSNFEWKWDAFAWQQFCQAVIILDDSYRYSFLRLVIKLLPCFIYLSAQFMSSIGLLRWSQELHQNNSICSDFL